METKTEFLSKYEERISDTLIELAKKGDKWASYILQNNYGAGDDKFGCYDDAEPRHYNNEE